MQTKEIELLKLIGAITKEEEYSKRSNREYGKAIHTTRLAVKNMLKDLTDERLIKCRRMYGNGICYRCYRPTPKGWRMIKELSNED